MRAIAPSSSGATSQYPRRAVRRRSRSRMAAAGKEWPRTRARGSGLGIRRERRRRQAQALEWLRAAILRIDEIALEVRGQHARRTAGGRGQARGPDRGEHRAQRVGRARDGGRAERGDTVAGSRAAMRAIASATVERIGPLDAVHVNVDESWHDECGRGDRNRTSAAEAAGARGQDVDDPIPRR